ncbi:MAG: hypothetical protein Q7R73_02135 [bacterium]|nr:hypothetical protein [bacterium]
MFSTKEILKKLEDIETTLNQGTIGVIQKFAELEAKLGLNGVLDLYNAPPDTFAMPSGSPRVYTNEIWGKRTTHIPAIQRSIREFSLSATGKNAYAAIIVRWPHHYQDFKEKGGITFSWSDDVSLALPQNHERFADYTDLREAPYLLHKLRGSFDYGQYGVIVCAIAISDLEKYIDLKPSSTCFRMKEKTNIPPEMIIGILEKPTTEEQDLIEVIVRGYWNRMRLCGYQARQKYPWKEQGQNPLIDEIPDELFSKNSSLPPEIELNSWAGGTTRVILEGWHRLAKINRIVAAHKTSATVPAFI